MALVPEVGLERVLAAGWLPERAPLDPPTRIAAARWLERHGRGGEGERLLARDAAPDVRWWLALFRRARGWETDAAKSAAAPPALARLPGWIELEAKNPVEVVFHANGPLHELAIERREGPVALVADSDDAAARFSHTTISEGMARTGEPLVVLQVDGVEHAAELVERGIVHLPMDLPPGPHRVWIWSEVPAIVGRLGAFR
jgi:hypothetical protein